MAVNIMCVDKSPRIFASLKNFLVDGSYGVFAYEDVVEALGAMETIQFAVAVVEQSIHGMDGLEFLKRIKNRSPQTAGILIADRLQLDKGIEAIDEGYVYRLIRKPCTNEKIRNAVKSGIARYEMMVHEGQEE